MELYFSSGAVKDAAEYVARKYPRGKVGVCDKEGTMTSALNAVGNPTVKADEARSDESVRMFVCAGDERELQAARLIAKEAPLVAVSDFAYGNIFEDYVISGNRNFKYGNLDAVFFDTSGDCSYLYSTAFAGAFGAYAEALCLACSARRGARETTARELLPVARDNLFAEISAEDLIVRTAEIKGRLNEGDTGYFGFAHSLYPLGEGEKGVFPYFFLNYIAVFLTIRFTNFRFCSILLGKDGVRARILAEKAGFPLSADVESAAINLEPYRTLTARYAPDERDLKAVLDRFLVETGGGKAHLGMLLNDLTLASGLAREDKSFISLLAGSGFIDALTDLTA